MNLWFSLKFKKFIFLLPLVILTNSAYADEMEIQMDWLIEGQLDDQNITTEEFQIVSSYKELVANENTQSEKPVYDRFVTNSQYSIGDDKITIYSEEGQIINGILIEQQELQDESFKHKIKYYDRFSDGYVEIAEALLDPIGNSKYIIQGRSLDFNPNSNLELFVFERGYTMDNLEEIPNDVFSPQELTHARALMEEAARTGDGTFDLRELSPNYLKLSQEQIKERMMNAFSEQTTQIFSQIISGEKLQRDDILSNFNAGISQPNRDSQNIFDNFKFEQPKFENTIRIHDSLQDNSFQISQLTRDFENISYLLIIPIFVGLAVFGYIMRRKLFDKKLEPLLQVDKPQIDYREFTKDMLKNSLSLYNNDKRKEAHEILSQAIRYYYSQKLGIYKEMTNFELLSHLRKSNANEYDQVRNWLLLCGSVEYAKYKFNNNDFKDALSKFSNEVS